jgi:hypothetical protein
MLESLGECAGDARLNIESMVEVFRQPGADPSSGASKISLASPFQSFRIALTGCLQPLNHTIAFEAIIDRKRPTARVLWGRQSCLQPPFRAALSRLREAPRRRVSGREALEFRQERAASIRIFDKRAKSHDPAIRAAAAPRAI